MFPSGILIGLLNPAIYIPCVSEIWKSLTSFDGLILGLSQFLLLPQITEKMLLTSTVVKSDSKINILYFLPRLGLNP